MRRVLAAFLSAFLGLIVSIPGEPVALVKGNDPGQFELVGLAPNSMTIEAGEVRLTGKPLGYFATRTSYQDFVLTFEYQYDRPEGLKSDADFRGNSGVLLHINGPPRVWPDCVQVQLAQADPGAIFAVGASKVEGLADPDLQKSAVKAVGEWNQVEVTSRGGLIIVTLNSVEVARGEKAEPAKGPIAWQSEGKPIRFRALKIRTLP